MVYKKDIVKLHNDVCKQKEKRLNYFQLASLYDAKLVRH